MIGVLPLMISLIFPLCGTAGADGIATPAPIDFAHLVRPSTPNTALAAPAGFVPAPDIATRKYDLPPAQLLADIEAVAAAQPRTYLQMTDADRGQAQYVARSALWNFPDLIAVQVNRDSTLILWSRSIYGQSDLGVNKKRLQTWLAALDAKIGKP